MCSTDVYCSKQTGLSSAKETITIISSFLELGEENCNYCQNLAAAQKMLLKTKQQTFVNGFIGFFITGHLYSARARRKHTIVHELPIDRRLYLHCSLIYFWVPSSCFCIVISLSLKGEIIRSAVSASRGRLHYPRRRRWWLHALTDRLLW